MSVKQQDPAPAATEKPDNDATRGDQAAAADGGEGENGPAALREEVEALRSKVQDAEDRYLRARAEVENTRRRAGIDVANAHKYAIERFAGEVLAVKDSLELARTVDIKADDKDAVAKMFEGVDLTLKLINSVFDKFALSEISPEPGDKFDPDLHQAMSTLASREVKPNHVVNVVQKGYRLNERLLRPAMVIVARAAPDNGSQGS